VTLNRSFICVDCGQTGLVERGELIACPACGAIFSVLARVPIFLPTVGPVVVGVHGKKKVGLHEVRATYDRAYSCDGLMGTDLDREYDSQTKKMLLDFSRPWTNKRILDVGTGIGRLWDYLPRDAQVEAHALDVSHTGILRAILDHPGLVGSVALAERLPYPDGFFDCVVAADTFEHALDPSRALQEAARVIRENGVLCASFPTRDSLRKWGYNRLIRKPIGFPMIFRLIWILAKRIVLFGRPDFQIIDRDVDIDQWQEVIENSGFAVTDCVGWPGAPEIPIVDLVRAVRLPR
jgi:ubiquinone/menaquinone biosynthesis C-methylase UbiE